MTPIGMLQVGTNDRDYFIEAARITYIDTRVLDEVGKWETIIWLEGGQFITVFEDGEKIADDYNQLVRVARLESAVRSG